MKNQFQNLLQQLECRLFNLLPLLEDDPIQYSPLAINMTMEAYETLRTAFLKHTCKAKEEIDFFKNCKPQLTSKLIYFNERFKIEANKPLASQKTIRKYYHTQLKKQEQFVMDNAEFYKYYCNGHEYLDDKYFLRNKQDYNLAIDSFCFQNDKLFATSHGYKVAQIMANTQLQDYLISKLKGMTKTKTMNQVKVLKWTGSKVGMIELVYALHTIGVFNHGASDVREIVKGFSCAFDIEIGQFHRTFYEISSRKSDRTKFLNTLKENLINRMNQADEYQI